MILEGQPSPSGPIPFHPVSTVSLKSFRFSLKTHLDTPLPHTHTFPSFGPITTEEVSFAQGAPCLLSLCLPSTSFLKLP